MTGGADVVVDTKVEDADVVPGAAVVVVVAVVEQPETAAETAAALNARSGPTRRVRCLGMKAS